MKPVSISERMMFSTILLIASDGCKGTGYFFNFKIENNYIPVIVTNKHVVNNDSNEKMKFKIHISDNDIESSGNVDIEYQAKWYFHDKYDICCCLVKPISDLVITETKRKLFYVPLDESLLPTNDILYSLNAIEEVTMVGYPNGLYDSMNNLPLFRFGHTAFHPNINFENQSIGIVDMACFHGSSGSPIFIYNQSTFSDRFGNVTMSAGGRLIFLGTLFSGPTSIIEGKTILPGTNDTLDSYSKTLINLGYYIKSIELLELKKKIVEDIKVC